VFYEEADSARGWETIAMAYGAKFPGGLDPLFGKLFGAAAIVSLLATLSTGAPWPGWRALTFLAHAAFGYRIVAARKAAAGQRALDLERYRALCSK
jgi:4-hydroxybenzoate polyprenyltransferase